MVGSLPSGWTQERGQWQVIAVPSALKQAGSAPPNPDFLAWTGLTATDMTVQASVLTTLTGELACVVVRYPSGRAEGGYELCLQEGFEWSIKKRGTLPQTLFRKPYPDGVGTVHTLTLTVSGKHLVAVGDGEPVYDKDGVASDFDNGVAAIASTGASAFLGVCPTY